MELVELKNIWSSLDQRLKNSQSVNKKLIKEMIETKIEKKVNRLLFWDGFGLVILLLVLPVLAYIYQDRGATALWTWKTLLFFGVGLCIFFSVWYIKKIYNLSKFNSANDIKNNMLVVNKYSIQTQRERIVMCIIFPILVLLCILFYWEAKVTASLWVFMICLLVLCALYTIWWYRYYISKRIDSIQRSLDELEELEEQESFTP